MKRLFTALTAPVSALNAWINEIPSKVGEITFNFAANSEARLYGLTKSSADIGDMSLAYYDSGSNTTKKTIVLLHGYSADKNVWPRFARALIADYRVLIPDLAGHGETGFNPTWNYSAPAQATRVAALLTKLGIKQAHVVGNSMGGFIAACFARMYPDHTLSAMLIDPAGVKSPKPSDLDLMLAQGRNPFAVHSRQEFETFYAMTMASPPHLPNFVHHVMSEKYQAQRAQLMQIFDDFHNHDMLDDQLADIKAPVLLLWGAKDRIIHVSSTDVWAAGLTHKQVVIWDDIGHMPMVERPKQSAQLYRQFLRDLSR